MKKITYFFIVVLAYISQSTYAQTLLWNENFGLDAACTNQNQNANGVITTNGTWAVTSIGTQGTAANEWFISSAEAFTGTGSCGDGCFSNPTLSNQTLHVGSVAFGVCPTGDCGATYNVGATGETHKRIESPVINATGVYGLSISFDYMHFGEDTNDKAGLVYFDGTTWSTLVATLPKTACCGGGCGTPLAQGQWAATKYTLDLPISANNNPNIKIGILWDNDANGVGADPSFAIDTIEVTYAVSCALFTTNIVYVDANGTGANNGTSWVDAFTDLQDAITAAEVCASVNTIYIAEGTYYPTTTADRTISFEIPGNTNVYGGFSPNNGVINLVTRDFNTYPTILDGDIGVLATTTDNSYHVISLLDTGTTNILDGLIIRNGYANGSGTNNLGGGIYAPNAQQEITVINSTISNNFATESGGGFYVRDAGNVYIFTTKINFNTSANLGGGFSNVNSELRTENVLFHDNSATLGGGLNYETSSLLFDVEIIGNTFTQNTASTSGSAIYLNNTGEVIFYFINNIFWNNGPGSIDILNFPNLTQSGSNSLYESGPLTGDCCLFNIDPLFTNPAVYDFSLQSTSPVIDVGVNSDVTQATDLNRNTRIIDGNSDGTATVDYGAYETAEVPDTTPPVITCPADIVGDCGTNPVTYTVTVTDNITNPFPPLETIAGFTFLGTNQNKTYYLSDAPATADVAFANAAGLGVTVATVEDAATNTYLRNAITAQAGGIQVYIGYNDATTEGAFEWQSGSTATYTNWNPGEPNDLGGEDYTLMTGTGSWNDVQVTSSARYVIEYFGTLEQTAGFSPNSDFPIGTTTNTFVATDFSGNTNTCSFDVTLTDTTDPVIVCPGDITQNNDPGLCGAFVDYAIPVPVDDCAPTQPVSIQQIDHNYNSTIFCNTGSSHLRIFNLPTEGVTTDYLLENINLGIASTNTTESFNVNIYLGDQLEHPIQTYAAPLSGQIPPLFSVNIPSPGFNTYVDVPVNIFIPTNKTVIVEVHLPVDANTRAIYNNDTTSETAIGYLNCNGQNYTPPLSAGLLIRLEGQEYLQQNTIQTAGLSPNSFFPIGTTTNTFVVTDGGGNTDTCSFDITINDTELPVLTCPADIIADNGLGVCGAIIDYTVYGSENCDVAPIPGFEQIGFTNEKAYYISDGIFTGPDAFADALLQGGVVATIPSAETQVFLFDRLLAKNKTYVHIGLTDVAAEGTFEWQDGSPVTYTNWAPGQPGAGSVNRNYVQLYSDTFWYNDVDDSAAFPYILEIANTTILTQTSGLPSGSEFPVGTTTNTFEVTDPSGNIGSCSFDVTVNDTEAPVAVCMDITIQLDATGNATIIAADVDGGSTDNCAVTDYQIDIDTFSCADVGTPVTVTLTIFDDALNSSSCTAIVTVEDVTAPVITCPTDQTETFDGNCEFTLPDYTGLATVTEACDPTPSVTQSPAPGTIITGNTVITLTAPDASSNSDSCTFTVLLVDDTPPTAVCQAFTAQLDAAGIAVITTTDVDGGSTDNCSIASMSVSPNTFTCAEVGTQTVTLTVTDTAGNISTCDAIVIVEDTIPPTAVCQDITVSLATDNTVTILPGDLDGGNSDNCSVASITASQTTFTCDDIGMNTITVTVTDVNGNTSTCTSIVTVLEDTPPIAICQPFTAQLDATGMVTILASDVDGGSTDNCAIDTITLSQNTFDCNDVGENTVIMTVTDVSGNSTSCTAIVTVQDTVAPEAMCQDITIQLDATGMATIEPQDVDGGSFDACGIVTIAIDRDTFDCSTVGPNNVTLSVTDVNGNVGTCIAVVTVEEENAIPMAVCQNITVPLQQDGTAVINASDIDGGSTGGGCANGITIDIDTFDCGDVGTPIQVTLSVTNGNGTIDTCTAIVNVVDTLDPVINCPESQTVQTNGTLYSLPDYVALGEVYAEDNCLDTTNISQTPVAGTLLDNGEYTINFVATDPSGNEAACSFRLTIEGVLDIPTQENLATLSIFPNPATNVVNLSNPNHINLKEVQLYDVTGRLIKTFKIDNATAHQMDISEIASATYFLLISSENGQLIKQLVKE
ncbi:HYR domain-containing protein [Rasiella sp. SM2506]|uniref:HYR domain-containing protein n=1 Tax=Rasiella sp. SM2506 TaxID=3423914 RepID=UPI003D7B5E31